MLDDAKESVRDFAPKKVSPEGYTLKNALSTIQKQRAKIIDVSGILDKYLIRKKRFHHFFVRKS